MICNIENISGARVTFAAEEGNMNCAIKRIKGVHVALSSATGDGAERVEFDLDIDPAEFPELLRFLEIYTKLTPHKIPAIKWARERFGLGLLEAKRLVEYAMEDGDR